MTLTFDRNAYGNLLSQYQPKVIQSEVENDAAIALATELEHRENLTTEESALLDLLVALIEQYEEVHYPIPESTPLDILLHLMQSNECKQEDLIGVIGSRGVVSEVVNGKRSISKSQARALRGLFQCRCGLIHLKASVFKGQSCKGHSIGSIRIGGSNSVIPNLSPTTLNTFRKYSFTPRLVMPKQ